MDDRSAERWLQTFTGLQFRPLDPYPGNVAIEDIAHALSLLCRFNGHCRKFYSVAEHSVLVSRLLPAEIALWGLLHDAAEAYLSDIPAPIKGAFPEIEAAEDRLLGAILNRFGLTGAPPTAVRDADLLMLATEKAFLMAREPAPWANLPPPLDHHGIECLAPEQAEAAFLARFGELTGSRFQAGPETVLQLRLSSEQPNSNG